MVKFLKKIFEIWKLEIEVRMIWRRCLIFIFHEYTYNVRGCGISIKRRRLSQLLQKSKVDLCFIQD